MELAYDDFFERPVIINVQDWTSATIITKINPWALWFNDPMVTQRMKGCGLWNGTLNLRFDVAASPYQYGKARFSFEFQNGDLVDYVYWLGKSKASQQYGVDIDASIPGGKEMSIPFIDIYDAPLVTVANQLDRIGLLAFTPINALQRADSVTSGTVQITIRAWMTNMKRYQPTRYEVIAQSGNVDLKAHSKLASPGMMTQASSTIKLIGSKLSEVPILNKIGTKIMKVGNVGLAVADLFGLSRPHDEQMATRHVKGFSSTAITDAGVNAMSMAFTGKQGKDLNVDDIGVTDGDQMSLSYICGRDSLVYQMDWQTTDARGSNLGSLFVNPLMSMKYDATYWDVTSLAYGSIPFVYWRGSLIYTFEIVSSSFHTGKVRILYDPQSQIGTTNDTTWPLAALENCTLDCIPGAKAEIELGWSSKELWKLLGASFVESGQVGTLHNGQLFVWVENILTAPLASQGVNINVYVRAGKDFQLFGIKDTMPQYGIAAPEAALEGEDDPLPIAQSAINGNAPPVSKCHFGSPSVVPDELDSKVFGERIVSLRALLKRFVTLGMADALVDDAPTQLITKSIDVLTPIYPPDMGHANGTGNGLTYFVKGNLFRWFRAGYVCARGGVRFRISPVAYNYQSSISTDPDAISKLGPVRVTAIAVTGTPSTSYVTNLTAVAATNSASGGMPSVSGAGSTVFDGGLLHEIEFEVPDYSANKFTVMSTRLGVADPTLSSESPCVWCRLSREIYNATAGCGFQFVFSFAVADDFSFFLWQGPPNIMYTG